MKTYIVTESDGWTVQLGRKQTGEESSQQEGEKKVVEVFSSDSDVRSVERDESMGDSSDKDFIEGPNYLFLGPCYTFNYRYNLTKTNILDITVTEAVESQIKQDVTRYICSALHGSNNSS